MSAGSFDFRSFQKYFSPQASGDLNVFLENLPHNAGKTALIAAGISWVMVAALGLFTVMQLQKLTEMRADLLKTEAIKPAIPSVSTSPVAVNDLKPIVDSFKEVYPGLTINATAGGITIQSKTTAEYAKFRELLGHVVNVGSGWQVSVDSICVGRECKQNALDVKLKIQKLKIDKPSDESTM